VEVSLGSLLRVTALVSSLQSSMLSGSMSDKFGGSSRSRSVRGGSGTSFFIVDSLVDFYELHSSSSHGLGWQSCEGVTPGPQGKPDQAKAFVVDEVTCAPLPD